MDSSDRPPCAAGLLCAGRIARRRHAHVWLATVPGAPAARTRIDRLSWCRSSACGSGSWRIGMTFADSQVFETSSTAGGHHLHVLLLVARSRQRPIVRQSDHACCNRRQLPKARSATSERQKKFAQIRAFGLMHRQIPSPSPTAVACSFTRSELSRSPLRRNACKAVDSGRLRAVRNKTA